jgi:hypothetical protein
MTVMQMREFFAAHPKLFDIVLILWVALVTAASVYTVASWR